MSVFYDLSKTPRNILNQAIVRAIVSENSGALFDPSDMSTMFQDAVGTTPVTAVEQPVGLMLDKSRGLMLGPELVSNGDFSSGTMGWVGSGAELIADSGILRVTAVGTSIGYAYTAIATTPGKLYKLSYTGFSGTSISGRLRGGSTPNNIDIFNVIIGGYSDGTRYFLAISSTTYFTVADVGSVEHDFICLDNISVREIKGSHAYQSITASRPTLSARKNILLATEALATQSVTTLAAQYTLSFTGTGSVTLSGAATGTLTGTGTDRASLTFTPTAGTLRLTVSGSVTKAQLELGTSAGPYQRVNTATDYDTDERYFPKYLRFDGVDDYLNLPYVGLYAGGEMSIIAARNAVSQSTDTYIISERSTTDADPKYFPSRQLAGGGNMDAYISNDAGSVVLDTVGSPFIGVANAVIRSIVDSGNNLKLFKNGVIAADDSYTRTSTLTLNNTTIGASVSTTTGNYASMKLYSLIITKSALSDAQRIKCERYAASKAGVIL